MLGPRQSLLLALCLAAPLVGCGHTEEEWQIQIDKNQRLTQQVSAAEAKAAQAVKDADDANRRAADASKQLEQLGGGAGAGPISASLAEREKALGDAKIRARLADALRVRVEVLRQKLDDVVKAGGMVGLRRSRIVITLPADAVFEKNREALTKPGKELLAKVATVIKTDPALVVRDVVIVAHGDDKPAKGTKDTLGPTVLRAREATAFLTGDKSAGLGPVRVSAAGAGDSDPIAPNDKDEGRAKNRRLEIAFEPLPEELIDVRNP